MKIYQIGDKVWYAQCKTVEKRELCPDCFGECALTVIKGNRSQVSIACVGCQRGYDCPTGYVTYYAHIVDVSEVEIEKVEIKKEGVTYGFHGCYCADQGSMFDTKAEAEARALVLAEIHNQEERDKIYRKHKYDHTWAWNAHYYRDCIKRAEKDLVYYTARLNVAKVKAKEWIEPKTEL